MKKNLPILFAWLLVATLLFSTKAMAQQPNYAKPKNFAAQQMSNPFPNNYSFNLYLAPKNGYGYDILKDGKPVFHQFVLMFMTGEGKPVFATKQQAQKAAALAIEKIRNGMSPSFTEAEIKKIAGY